MDDAPISDTVLMTYKRLAEALGLGSADAARIKAKRRGWKVIPGNHPLDQVQVEVPVSALQAPGIAADRDRDRPRRNAADRAPDALEGWRQALDVRGGEVARLAAMLDAERVDRGRLVDLVSEAMETAGRAQARADAAEAELAAARAEAAASRDAFSELKKLTAALVARIEQPQANDQVEELRSQIDELRQTTGKTLIGFQKFFRP